MMNIEPKDAITLSDSFGKYLMEDIRKRGVKCDLNATTPLVRPGKYILH